MQTQDYEIKYDGSFNHVPRTHYENFSTGYSKLTPNVGDDLNFLSTIHFQKTGRSLTGDLPWFIPFNIRKVLLEVSSRIGCANRNNETTRIAAALRGCAR